jgi:acyl-CoA synthetase (AMP-forming)/AMP-acid ligase II
LNGELRFADPQPWGVVCRRNAADDPNSTAIEQAGRVVTWSGLERCVSQVAHGLRDLGVRAGAHVAVLGRNAVEMLEIAHGAAWVGAIFTPVNWRLAAREIEYILRDSGAEVLFISTDMWSSLAAARDRLDFVKQVIVFASEAPAGCIAYETWRDAQSDDAIEREIEPDEVVLQIYTSGTTGLPKGAMLSHRYFMSMGAMGRDQAEEVWGLKKGEVYVVFSPLFHIAGIAKHYHAAIRGCGIVLLKEFNTDEVIRLMGAKRVQALSGVPSMYQALLNDPRMDAADSSGMRYCIYGAAPMSPVLRDKLMQHLGCRFAQFYGMTESALVTCLAPADHLGEAGKAASVGRPLPGVQVKIVDPQGCTVAAGQVGEIAVQSPAIFSGYWNLPDPTRDAFRDGWYLTGDGGYLDEEGYLFLKDRIRDVIISGGENIYPAEIENVLVRHPVVASVAVVGVPDEKWGEVPKAFIVLNPGCELMAAELHAFVASHLGRYKLPKYYEAIDCLPLNGAGKVLKTELRARHTG